jgi:hypothetical protein
MNRLYFDDSKIKNTFKIITVVNEMYNIMRNICQVYVAITTPLLSCE